MSEKNDLTKKRASQKNQKGTRSLKDLPAADKDGKDVIGGASTVPVDDSFSSTDFADR